MNKIILQRLIITVLIAFSGWLAFSCLNYSAYLRTINHTKTPDRNVSPYNLLIKSHQISGKKLQLQAQELDRVLEFMVWPGEREKLLRQSIQVSQQQVNLQPTKVQHWQRLLNSQYELTPESESLSLILENIYKLSGWNHRALIHLSRYCIPFAFEKEIEAPIVCNDIVNHLPLQNQKDALARRIGISRQELDVVFTQYQHQ